MEKNLDKSFFVRWLDGVKLYLSSPRDLLFLKLLFLGFVVVGLFAGSVQLFLSGSFWFAWVSCFFGFVTLVDFRLLFISYMRVKHLEGFL